MESGRGLDWFDRVSDRDRRRALVNAVGNFCFIKYGEFLE